MAIDTDNYKALLKDYIETLDEGSLYGVEQISKLFIQDNIPPDEIVNIHNQALMELRPELSKDVQHAMHFLLGTMISYGLAHREIEALRESQYKLKSEISVAASMQETFLATTKPQIDNLDIGVISVPAEQMNGDYHHFVKAEDGSLGIAIADVIGKGVPAALCMSMIKYSMESYSEETMSPSMVLENLNRVVERNVDPNMFITMFYAQYLPSTSKLRYASAGHEPGFYYNAEKATFEEIKTEGLVLGVLPNSSYKLYDLEMNKGDMVILLTDGVTECKQDDRFIEKEEVLEVIKENIKLPTQELVDQVYKYFERLQNFRLADDFTLIILKKEV